LVRASNRGQMPKVERSPERSNASAFRLIRPLPPPGRTHEPQPS
jgi:hypothetical protein